MFGARRHLSWFVWFWLAAQIAGVAAAPLAFCCTRVVTADDEEQCCPGLLPGQVCPMHHTREGERTCKMRDACGRADAALVALAGGVGVLPQATPLVNAFDLGDRLRPVPQSAIVRAYRPESPPPRA
jgi:hypothetical protein